MCVCVSLDNSFRTKELTGYGMVQGRSFTTKMAVTWEGTCKTRRAAGRESGAEVVGRGQRALSTPAVGPGGTL